MVKKGGTMIILHPCTDQFDNEHHAPYIEFVHRLLPETRDAMELHKRYEAKFAANPAYIEMYRVGHAYHPTHPFFMWYWGEAGRQHLGRMIVVGADNEYIPKLLGWETARTMDEALRMAKTTAPPRPEILALHCAADPDGGDVAGAAARVVCAAGRRRSPSVPASVGGGTAERAPRRSPLARAIRPSPSRARRPRAGRALARDGRASSRELSAAPRTAPPPAPRGEAAALARSSCARALADAPGRAGERAPPPDGGRPAPLPPRRRASRIARRVFVELVAQLAFELAARARCPSPCASAPRAFAQLLSLPARIALTFAPGGARSAI